MHTPEQAKKLWCPMARVAQAGSIDTSAAYNRTLTRQHIEVTATVTPNPDDFQLGDAPAPEQRTELVLHSTHGVSMAAKCLGDGCAMWRWYQEYTVNDPEPAKPLTRGYCGLAGRPETTI